MGELDLILPAILSAVPWDAGSYYDAGAQFAMGAPTGVALGADILYSSLLWVPPSSGGIDRIGIVVTLAGTATLARLGIYAKGVGALPGALLFDAGAVDISGTGDKEITIAQRLPPGQLVMPAMLFNGTVTVHIYASPTESPLGWATAGATTRRVSWNKASTTYGALPATFPASPTVLQTMPRIQVRAA